MESYVNSNGTGKKAITEAMKLAEIMLKIAEKGFHRCEDDSCLQVYGVIRDCGHKIRRTVEQEQFFNQENGEGLQKLH